MDHMTTSVRMDKDRSHMTERIFNLTLDIICLLTGEGFPPLKSGDQVTITIPPPHFLVPERNMKKKILHVINKITELLMGEVPISCQALPPFSSKEQWQNVEGHKDLSKDIMMENQPPFTSPDGSSYRKPPESRAGPLYFWDCTPQDQIIPHHYQVLELTHLKTDIEEKKETPVTFQQQSAVGGELGKPIKKGEVEMYVRSDQKSMEEGDMMRTIKKEEETYVRSDQKSVEEGDTMRTIKEEEEETYVRGDQQSMQEGDMRTKDIRDDWLSTEEREMLRTNKEDAYVRSDLQPIEDECPLNISTGGHDVGNASEEHLYSRNTAPMSHQTHHTDVHLVSCSDCGKGFKYKRSLQRHQRNHTGIFPFSCSECGKGYNDKRELHRHQRSHTDEPPFSCSEGGISSAQKASLGTHQRSHTSENPFLCSECGKGFGRKENLLRHMRIHTGKYPFSCSECGKKFNQKMPFLRHQSSHTGVHTFSCSECGKSFNDKYDFLRHLKTHTREQPSSCSDCGKMFNYKRNLLRHQRSHTDIYPIVI